MKRRNPDPPTDEEEDDPRTDLHLYVRFTPPSEKDFDRFFDLHQLYAEAEAWHQQQWREAFEQRQSAFSRSTLLKPPGSDPANNAMKNLDDEQVCLNARIQIHEASSELVTRMLNGDRSAAEAVLTAAHDMTVLLQIMYSTKPDLFREKVQFMRCLPVLADLEPGWVKSASKHMQSLRLGEMLSPSHLKPSAYKTERNICRAWARRAIEVLEQNRFGPAYWQSIPPYLEAGKRPDLKLKIPPEWVTKVWALPLLSSQTVKQWCALSREMIREQMPDFHGRDEFKTEMARIKARTRHRDDVKAGRTLTGTLQNALLDKIADAMRSIVA